MIKNDNYSKEQKKNYEIITAPLYDNSRKSLARIYYNFVIEF